MLLLSVSKAVQCDLATISLSYTPRVCGIVGSVLSVILGRERENSHHFHPLLSRLVFRPMPIQQPEEVSVTMDWGAEKLTVANKSSMLLIQSENDTGLITNDSILAGVMMDPQRFPLYLRITATSICVLLLMIGCTGNILVPLVVLKTKDLRNSTNIFLINLSIADLLILLISSPTVLIELHTQPETWYLGLFMCKFFFLFSLLATFPMECFRPSSGFFLQVIYTKFITFNSKGLHWSTHFRSIILLGHFTCWNPFFPPNSMRTYFCNTHTT